MDFSKAPNPRKLQLCRTYFYAGFALLPFVWAINVCWCFEEAFRKPPFPEQSQIKRFVIYSAVGTLLWIVALIAWIIIFQTNRTGWGATADYMSFMIPLGSA
ncbi:gamma-secretase subunit pen-2 [Drosophila pseudoobscura]|uniref:Gamma-secretase subunit PEN-2 n=1 Tax=Drosophila pseudoobscura pseudoobscura TaxID=46245 RepID=A0A6I8V4F9_DROPS|nr:gamma-secretase subunit pen-2 [Drosophila pseudoobscura]